MVTESIQSDGPGLFPSSVLFLRALGLAVEVISTEGALRIETDRPRLALRDLQGGTLKEARAGMRIGAFPFDYRILGAKIVARRKSSAFWPAIVPDNVPLDKGTILVETRVFGDYHTFDSLRIVGIKTNGCLVMGFADAVYEMRVPAHFNPRKMYREAIERHLLNKHEAHFCALAAIDYLYPATRFYFEEITEVDILPKAWGSTIEILTDLRGDPSHSASKIKVVLVPPKAGIDIS